MAAAAALLCLALLVALPSAWSAAASPADGCKSERGSSGKKRKHEPKLWVFGDSYADTGNLGDLGRELTHAWYDPYGETFPRRPAGRFSDGRVLTDFVDDSVAIMMAFQAPGVEVLGLTTIFGNCTTAYATRNALILCEKAGRTEEPVAEGSAEPLKGGKPHVADFVHGSDGLGNIPVPDPTTKKAEQTAAEFLVDQVSRFPGEVSVLALGPLTNVALAIKMDPSFVTKVKKIVVLGGAFFAAGNATPSAEANIHSDPEAADIVFTSGADIYVVGLNITTQVSFTVDDLAELRNSEGKHAQFLCDICKFYSDWHFKSYGDPAVFLHDPVSFAALVRPELFTFRKGVVRVETQGICKGHTSMDMGLKKFNTENAWTGYTPISVAWTVDKAKVVAFVKDLLTKTE